MAVAIAAGIAALYLLEAVRYFVRVFRWLPRYQRWARTTSGLCPNCGYDLTGNISKTCPECGSKVQRAENQSILIPSLITESQPWWVWAAVVGMMILAVFLQRSFWA
jgi:hypothetical protein